MSVIIMNAIVYALADYKVVDEQGNLMTRGSTINTVISYVDNIFPAIFILEMALKMPAFGINYKDPNSYFRDSWNIVDFVIVVLSIISFFPQIPNSTIVRTVRCFRPLKALTALPVLQDVIEGIIQSFSKLTDVFLILIFCFIFFSIAGVQLFSGPYLHTRCRLTPYPVTYDWQYGLDYSLYKCLPNATNVNLASEYVNMTKSTSPWSRPQDCMWPFDPDDTNMCSLSDSSIGGHVCFHGDDIAPSDKRWCGSNFDGFGNKRFTNFKIMMLPNYNRDSNWGFTNFDNMGQALVTIFQLTTVQGWSDICYDLQNSTNIYLPPVFVIIVVFFGNYLIVNLLIAIWQTNTTRTLQNIDLSASALVTSGINAPITSSPSATNESPRGSITESGDVEMVHHRYLPNGGDETAMSSSFSWSQPPEPTTTLPSSEMNLLSRIRKIFISTWEVLDFLFRLHSPFVRHIIYNPIFNVCILICILVNTLILLLNYYPSPPSYEDKLAAGNFVMTIVFAAEALIRIVGLGILKFSSSLFNLFDFGIVLWSIIESTKYPPVIFFGGTSQGLTAGASVLRSFRLLGIMKLIPQFKSLHVLFLRMVKGIMSSLAFVIIIFIVLIIYSLIGMSLYANRLRFDDEGFPILEINSDAWINAPDRPRSNFDNFLLAFSSVFAILSTESWNTIMYDLWRYSKSGSSVLFTFSIICTCNVVLLNLFVARVIEDFETPEERLLAEEQAEVERHRREDDDDDKMIAERTAMALAAARGDNKMFSRVQDGLVHSSAGKMLSEAARNAKKRASTVASAAASAVAQEGQRARELIERESRLMEREANRLRQLTQDEELFSFIKRILQAHSSTLRTICTHKVFEYFVFLIITVSTIALILDNPLRDPESRLKASITWFNDAAALIFVAEMAIKIGGLGLSEYFSDYWNVFDCIITILSFIGLGFISRGSSLAFVRSIRTLRIMRSFRLLGQFRELRLVIDSLFISLPSAFEMIMVAIVLYLIFGCWLCLSSKANSANVQEVCTMTSSLLPSFPCLS